MIDLSEEKRIFERGLKFVGGIDEAGRGPLAGPVVAACVVLGNNFKIDNKKLKLVKDSKKLSPKRREELFSVIQEEVLDFGIGICDQETIDRINVLEASFLAMKKAISALRQKPDFIVLDGRLPIPNISIQQRVIKEADNTVFCVAAASILAKVTRDRIMLEMHEKYPMYRFDKHKGYGTKLHLEMLEKFGPCPIHRRSFAPVKKFFNNN